MSRFKKKTKDSIAVRIACGRLGAISAKKGQGKIKGWTIQRKFDKNLIYLCRFWRYNLTWEDVMALAGEVAKYIIKSLPVDNLKLQKLLYYSQAVHLVLNDKTPLFLEPIEAWDYGPVVPPVYREYKPYGFDILPPIDEPVNLEFNEIRAVDMALSCFGEMSGPALINQTHFEDPWKNAYRPGRPSGIISLDAMYEFFRENLDFTDEA